MSSMMTIMLMVSMTTVMMTIIIITIIIFMFTFTFVRSPLVLAWASTAARFPSSAFVWFLPLAQMMMTMTMTFQAVVKPLQLICRGRASGMRWWCWWWWWWWWQCWRTYRRRIARGGRIEQCHSLCDALAKNFVLSEARLAVTAACSNDAAGYSWKRFEVRWGCEKKQKTKNKIR